MSPSLPPPLRIALFSEVFLPSVDGVVNTVCRLVRHLDRRGHRVLIFAPQGAPRRFANAPVIGLPAWPLPVYPDYHLVVPPGLDRLSPYLEAFRPDIVHVASPVWMGDLALTWANRRGVPAVAVYHTDIPGFAQRYGFGWLTEPIWWLTRRVYGKAQRNLAPTEVVRAELTARGIANVHIWGRGVDADLFAPQRRSAAMRERLSAGHPDAPLLLYTGRLAVEKRIEWLRPVLDALPQARLAIVGDGPDRPRLEKIFADAPVVFMGYLFGDELAAAYASADCFVFPSANETFGNVVLEAMAAGLPVVGVAAGGVRQLVQHGATGWLADADDPEAFVAYVRRLVEEPAVAHEMGALGREAAEQRNWDAVGDELLAHYAALIARRPASAVTGRRAATIAAH